MVILTTSSLAAPPTAYHGKRHLHYHVPNVYRCQGTGPPFAKPNGFCHDRLLLSNWLKIFRSASSQLDLARASDKAQLPARGGAPTKGQAWGFWPRYATVIEMPNQQSKTHSRP